MGEKEKQAQEFFIFKEFATTVNNYPEFDFDISSIKNEPPPKPDISCRLNGKECFFELTEITDEKVARIAWEHLKGCFFSQDEPLIRTFAKKEKKTYEGLTGDLHLLAYYDKQVAPIGRVVVAGGIVTLTMQRMIGDGPWVSIWIFDTWKKEFVVYTSE
jgi:hypothetical protein